MQLEKLERFVEHVTKKPDSPHKVRIMGFLSNKIELLPDNTTKARLREKVAQSLKPESDSRQSNADSDVVNSCTNPVSRPFEWLYLTKNSEVVSVLLPTFIDVIYLSPDIRVCPLISRNPADGIIQQEYVGLNIGCSS